EVLRGAVKDIVDKQVEAGIDVVDDGEMGKTSWITYLYERVSGLEARLVTLEGASMLPPSRDRQVFPGAYAELDAHPETEAFLPVVAPASAYWLTNEHYGSEEEFIFALADALHEEYKAIVDSGLLLQVDDAVLMHEWDTMLSRGQTDDDYRRWAQLRVDALNHALRGLPEDRVRYHVCWGSWHGPHAYDPPLKDTVGLILQVTAGYYAMEQANARHEHEWRVWEHVALPEGKKLIPGVVTHHTNVVEHPEL